MCTVVFRDITISLGNSRFSATPEEGGQTLLSELCETENELHFLFCRPFYDDVMDVPRYYFTH